MLKRKISLYFLLFSVLSLTGCSIKYTLKDPTLSDVGYSNQKISATTIAIIDKRAGLDQKFTTGKLGFGGDVKDISNILSFDNIPDPIEYLARNLEKEFAQRGIPVKCAVGTIGGHQVSLEVVKYQIISYRASGFSPWESCHVFEGAIINNGKSFPIKSYFYNGKTPVWSMDEIQEPCFEIPSSIVIQDIASKINKAVFNLKTSDETVEQLAGQIDSLLKKKDITTSFWKVIELGNTNNMKAMEPLKKYAKEGDEFFRSCALSSIGTLGPEGLFDFLKERYANTLYNEKYMAIKAIGDIGSQEGHTFIQELKKDSLYTSEGGFRSAVDLYSN